MGIIEGMAGTLMNGILKGWAYDNDLQNNPLSIILETKYGQKVVIANSIRRDLTARSPIEQCGFQFELTSKEEYEIISGKFKVMEQSTLIELSTPSFAFNKEHKASRYFFMHIPKTAGTSLRNFLYSMFPQNFIYPNIYDIKFNGGGYPSLKSTNFEDFYKNKICFMGHYPLYVSRIFDPSDNLKVFTFFRNPVQRVISYLFHAKHNFKGCQYLSLPEINSKFLNQTSNYQIKYLLSEERFRQFNDNPELKINREDLESAMINLRKFSYIGLTEDYDSSMMGLCEQFNWQLNIKDVRKALNVNKLRNDSLIDPDLLKKIEDQNRLEIEFYDNLI